MAFPGNGVYRFFTVPSAGLANYYFTLTPTGTVKGALLATSDLAGTQKWKVTKRTGGFYDIANIGTGQALGLAPPGGFETEHTLSVSTTATATSWDLQSNSAGKLTVRPTDPTFDNKVVDYSASNRLILWDSNSLPNQAWSWELLSLQWIAAQNGVIPTNAVPGGYEPDGRTLYVARGIITGVTSPDICPPGKAAPHLATANGGGCIVGWNFEQYTLSHYEVLVGDPSLYVWVPYNFDPNNITLNGKKMTPLSAGYEGAPLSWSAQGVVGGGVIPGKAWSYGVFLTYNGVENQWKGDGCKLLCYA